MQKAMVVRASAGASARSWSQAVDGGGADRPLAAWLAEGWRVANAHPMPGDLDSCCLVVLEHDAPAAHDRDHDRPLAALTTGEKPPARSPRVWDGETIPLSIFGLTG